jgi:hypothetical protein
VGEREAGGMEEAMAVVVKVEACTHTVRDTK